MFETKEKTVYTCGYCGQPYWDKSKADLCHNDRICADCGDVMGKRSYYTVCNTCQVKKRIAKEQELFDKAIKITFKDYCLDYTSDYLYIDDKYVYLDDLEYEFDDYEDEDLPKFMWATKPEVIMLCDEEIIQDYEEHCEIEDYEMDREAMDEIGIFCKQWNEKHAQTVFYEDRSIAVLLSKEDFGR
jgi:hypothetical protein